MSDRAEPHPKAPQAAEGLSRREVLLTAAVAAGALAAAPGAPAEAAPAGYGAPLVELHFPAGALTLEQKSVMIRDITEVMVDTMKLPSDPGRWLFVQIIETAEGGFGVNGQVFVPRHR